MFLPVVEDLKQRKLIDRNQNFHRAVGPDSPRRPDADAAPGGFYKGTAQKERRRGRHEILTLNALARDSDANKNA